VREAGRILRPLSGLVCGSVILAFALPAADGASQHPANRPSSTSVALTSLVVREAGARQTMQSLARQEAELGLEAAATAARLGAARRSLGVAQGHLGQRLRALYEGGDEYQYPLEVILGASSFSDALTELDSLQRTASQDRAWIERSQALRSRLTALARSLDERRLAVERLRLSAEATAAGLGAAQAAADDSLRVAPFTSRRVARVRAPAARTPPPLQDLLTVVASAYSIPGATATGTHVGFGTVAVDPTVIPLGTRLSIPGYGDGLASDTGSAVRGARIDVWLPTIEQALAWGTRTVTIQIQRG
jgi:3D (Asp-Asp-Asp) domain-containing protein